MPDRSGFSTVWHEIEAFEGPSQRQPAGDTFCPYAVQFWHWCRELCADLEERPTVVTVNQRKVLLLDKYFEWRTVVPKAHRHRVNAQGHRCIWHVFDDTYGKLKAIELALTPPMLFLPPKQPRAPKPIPSQAAGIFLGEIEEGHRGR